MATEEAASEPLAAEPFEGFSPGSKDESEAAVPVDTNIVHSREELCEICRILLFEPATYEDRGLQGELRYYARKCRFCRYLFNCTKIELNTMTMLTKHRDETFDPTLDRGFIKLSSMKRLHLIGGTESNYEFPFWRSGAHTRSSLKEPSNANVNFAEIKEWLQVCEGSHGGLCARQRIASLPGLRLINCITRKISNAPQECEYVALSYLWGKSAMKTTSSTPDYLPSPAPQVIEDALLVTMELGFLYLWVDRYCIDQDDVETKHKLIQNMDKVYNTAEITIIDAVGDSPDFGLAGVSTPRSTLNRFQVEDYRIFFVPHTGVEVSESPWSTRGWTFQEGILSRRRLIFSKSHTYLHCQTTACRQFSYEVREELGMPDFVDPETLVFPEKGIGSGIKGFNRHIENYFNRDLTFDSDVIEAFHGVLNAFQNMEFPVYHLWGLPFEYTGPETPALSNLLWKLKRNFTKEDFVERRQGFPSWTWAGWKTSHHIRHEKFSSSEQTTLLSIHMRTLEGEMMSLGSYITNNRYKVYEPSLHLTGWVGHVELSGTVPQCEAFISELLDGALEYVDLVIDDRTKATMQRHLDKRCRWKYMLISNWRQWAYLILLQPVDGKVNTYTRLGVARMTVFHLDVVHDEANEVLNIYPVNKRCSTECSTECDQHEKEVLRKESIILV